MSRQMKTIIPLDDCITVPNSLGDGRILTGSYLVRRTQELLVTEVNKPSATLPQDEYDFEHQKPERPSLLPDIHSDSDDED